MQKALILCKAYSDGENISGDGIYTAAALSKLGVSTSAAAKISAQNSAVIREFLQKNGVDDSLIIDNENDDFAFSCEDFDAVFITGEFILTDKKSFFLAKKLCEECKKLEIPVVFDPGKFTGAENTDIINDLAVSAEVFVPAADDAKALCGLSEPEEIADKYISLGVNKIVVTLGKAGAFYKSHVENGAAPTFRADKVVDLTGAGDAFDAGLISGVIEKIPLGESVVRANACGCCAIQHSGFRFPSMQELREYMLTHRFVVDGCKDY